MKYRKLICMPLESFSTIYCVENILSMSMEIHTLVIKREYEQLNLKNGNILPMYPSNWAYLILLV